MKMDKFMFVFGFFFLVIPLSVCIPLIALFQEDPMTVLFGCGIAIPFLVIGSGFMIAGIKPALKRKKFLKEGISYYGKIVSYQPNSSIRINGEPLLHLEVRYFDRYGRISSASVSTGTGSKIGFNLGETVQIAELNGEVILISEKSQNIRIQGEDTLIMTYNSGAQSIDQLRPESYFCPHCGANLMIVRGQTVKCPYCDSFVTNTRQYA